MPPPDQKLRDLQSVTDAALAYLGLEDLLNELLVRVVGILEVDTAAILLLDEERNELVARAARGLEEEVERGVRIPVGRGFAGRIARERRPVQITDLSSADIVSPLLREKGLKSLLGAPLLVEGSIIGVLHVGTLTPRHFDDDEVELLQSAADRASLGIHGKLTERERGLADALERSLMPTLPDLPGLELAGRYLPAVEDRLGGDWYDAFVLPGGGLGVVIGDVVGHGFRAAALMGQLRSGVRAYALEQHSPRATLERLGRLLRQLEPGGSATLLYIVLDLSEEEVTMAGAGHPPPLMVGDDGSAEYPELPPSVPLGATQDATYEEVVTSLGPASTLVLFTDGVVERPGESLDRGLERLVEAVDRAGGEPDEICDSITHSLLPEGAGDDDAAVLVVKSVPLSDPLKVRLPARAESVPVLRRVLGRWLQDAGARRAEVDDLSLACSEACANSIEHAYPPGEGTFEVTARSQGRDEVEVEIRDYGSWRAPRGQNRGRGTLLMEGLVDAVEVKRGPKGTAVRLKRRLAREAA